MFDPKHSRGGPKLLRLPMNSFLDEWKPLVRFHQQTRVTCRQTNDAPSVKKQWGDPFLGRLEAFQWISPLRLQDHKPDKQVLRLPEKSWRHLEPPEGKESKRLLLVCWRQRHYLKHS